MTECPAPDSARPLFGGPLTAAALVLGMFTEAVGYGMVAPTLPFMARTVGAGETALGLLVGAIVLGAGIWIDKSRDRRWQREMNDTDAPADIVDREHDGGE